MIERERLGFNWADPGEAPSTVEFAIEAVPGGTRIVVTETASGPSALSGDWTRRLAALRRGLALVLA